jgi:hypothetical protein
LNLQHSNYEPDKLPITLSYEHNTVYSTANFIFFAQQLSARP